MKFRLFHAVAALVALGLAVGCGKELNRVHGTVTLDGQPLEDALVIFTPATGGRPAAARTDAQGKYELVYTRDAIGTVVGEYVVEIRTAEERVLEDDTVEIVPERVPAKYNFNTELRETVTEGENIIDFELDSEGEIIQSEDELASEEG